LITGVPEVITAKDAYTKDQNPQNFSSFNKLQGLKHGNVRCLLEDQFGNVWLGTEGGGVSKYDGKSFTHFTNREGLSNNDVRCMLQDKEGIIWFGTNGGGISKYDGKSFENFTTKGGLPHDDILSIAEDQAGNIWFGTNGGGVVRFNPEHEENGTYHIQKYTEENGLPNNVVWSVLCDQRGNMWFGTGGSGLAMFNQKRFSYFKTAEGLADEHVITLKEDHAGNIWIGTEGGGICKLNWNTSVEETPFSFTTFTKEQGLSENVVRSITEDQYGNLWFGTIGGGVSKYTPTITEETPYGIFVHFTSKEGLTNAAVSSILEDRSGNIWFATYGGGISKYDGKLFTHFTTQEGLSSNSIWSMISDNKGNLWFGSGGSGVSKYDGKSFTHFTTREGLCHNDVRSMLEDRAGNLWFGTFGGGVSKYIPADEEKKTGGSFTHFSMATGLSGDDIRSIEEDQYGQVWFTTSGGGVTMYDGKSFTQFTTKQGLSADDVRCVMEDQAGNLWFATSGGGITKMVQQKNGTASSYTFTHFTKKEGLTDDFVLCILEDKAGNLWFGTYGNGIMKMTPDASEPDRYKITSLSEKEGLANNFVFSILEDKTGCLWFGTRFGLSKLTPEKLQLFTEKVESESISKSDVFFKNYTYEDGFLGIGCNGKAICQGDDGTIWIGTNDRLTAYHPAVGAENKDTIPPDIQLTGISLFNEPIAWINFENNKDTGFILGNGVQVGDFEFDDVSKWYGVPQNLSLAYNNNYLTFNFIGITMDQPKSVKYQYKLEGVDQNWSAITNRTEAPYGNLAHGSYIFKVKAMNCDGVWSEEYQYAFTIRPPYWKTWWFRTLVGGFILLSLFGVYRWRTASLRRRQKQLEQTVMLRTTEVVEQKQLIEEKHKEITDSINYAERIQRSFLASKESLDKNLKEYFVLFQPKDVVSGDFYWATQLHDGKFALATADSTGHGVPGAIMSILNITCLEKAIDEMKLVDPGEILNHTRLSIIDRLKRDGSSDGGKDGMDASLICFDPAQKKLTYAAANNPVWIVRPSTSLAIDDIIVCEPDNMPVAKHDKQHQSFTSKQLDLQAGDVIYTLTDGYPDQFGGPKGKKFMYKKLKQLILSISHEPMHIQKEKLNDAFQKWKGSLEQVDDVCIIGIRI
jgi:ligand-binding sensor domain-containing protein/serine phosphatase RsbU (regulator of sigma subunit)